MDQLFAKIEATLKKEEFANRTKLLLGFSIFFVAFALCFMSFYLGKLTRAATDTVSKIHYSYGNTSDTVVIKWRGPEQYIFYGPDTTYQYVGVAQSAGDISVDNNEPFMQVQLTGLASGTTYHYKIGLEGIDHTFRTKFAK